MSFPQNRTRTFAAGSQIPSADLNAWQDQIIANFRGKGAVISPSAITGTVNNWDPTGLDVDVGGGGGFLPAAQVIRVTLSGNVILTSIARGIAGRVLEVVIVSSGGFYMDLPDSHASGTNVNRLLLPGAVTRRLRGDGARALLWYDGTSARWRVVAVHTTAGDHGLERLIMSPLNGTNDSDANWQFSKTLGCLASIGGAGGDQTRGFGIPLLEGCVLEQAGATVRGNVGGILTMSVHKADVGGVTDLGDDATTAAFTDQGLSITGMAEPVELGEHYYIQVESSAPDLAYRIYEMWARFSRPGKP